MAFLSDFLKPMELTLYKYFGNQLLVMQSITHNPFACAAG
ncbi:hypothetical protein SynMVIR181_00718 [Synechococcus sp. MVIR-18-1]|nr:hypothetical protein SynMVIR181_00718 [Synechococcus sp. MVIR-18-1]